MLVQKTTREIRRLDQLEHRHFPSFGETWYEIAHGVTPISKAILRMNLSVDQLPIDLQLALLLLGKGSEGGEKKARACGRIRMGTAPEAKEGDIGLLPDPVPWHHRVQGE